MEGKDLIQILHQQLKDGTEIPFGELLAKNGSHFVERKGEGSSDLPLQIVDE